MKIPKASNRSKYYLDDSSDEEEEKAKGNVNVKLYPDPSKNTNLDIHHSYALQDLGIRLLHSAPVRKIYFPFKKKQFGKYETEYDEDNIRNSLENYVKDIFSEYKKLHKKTNSKCKELEEEIDQVEKSKTKYKKLTDKKKILKNKLKEQEEILEQSKKFVNEIINSDEFNDVVTGLEGGNIFTPLVIKEKLDLFSNKIKKLLKNKYDALTEIVIEYHVKLTFQALEKRASKLHTEKPKTISKSEKTFSQIKQFISDDQYGRAFLQAHQYSKKVISESQWLQNVKDKIDVKSVIDSEVLANVIVNLFPAARPVLDNSIILSTQYITEEEDHAVALLSYTRLLHCDLKRNQKNIINQPDYSGESFVRTFFFDSNDKKGIIETYELSTLGTISSKVAYDIQGRSYEALVAKLSEFMENSQVKDKIVARMIKSILKTGDIYADAPEISPNFKYFLKVLTYHLFGTEVQRHPAAAIHNAMAIDLVESQNFKFKLLLSLPMVPAGIVPVCRYLQSLFSKENDSKLKYFYDRSVTSIASPNDPLIEKFLERERKLLQKWVTNKKVLKKFDPLDDPFTMTIAESIDALCHDFFGVHIIGEE